MNLVCSAAARTDGRWGSECGSVDYALRNEVVLSKLTCVCVLC